MKGPRQIYAVHCPWVLVTDRNWPESRVKETAAFAKFLVDTVNLNQSRIDALTARVRTVSNFLRGSDWGSRVLRCSPQGSWAHGTIIKPVEDQGFDADLVAFVAHVPSWTAGEYLTTLRATFSRSDDYKDRVGLRTRCVTLTYAGDFTIDVVPCITNRPGSQHRFEVCNRKDDDFEATDSEAYTNWFTDRDRFIGVGKLKHVIRLLKYLRDIKETFSCKSILLTTLVAQQITARDRGYLSQLYPDLPTTLRVLVTRLDVYLQARPRLHDVSNPVLPAESFIRHWDQEKYATFREMIHTYRGWIEDAYKEADANTSIEKWQRVFGSEFKGAAGQPVKIAESAVTPAALGIGSVGDAVVAVKRFGSVVLANVKARLPWMKPAPWRVASQSVVGVRATAHLGRGGAQVQEFTSGTVLRAGLHVRFEAHFPNGTSYANTRDFDVQWQVVNTDHAAWQKSDLRGDFYPSQSRAVRWEEARYRGIHWVQAFVIRRRDRACVGKSERFFVVVE
jgi:hypothetical protein